jgi:hypothetical protein
MICTAIFFLENFERTMAIFVCSSSIFFLCHASFSLFSFSRLEHYKTLSKYNYLYFSDVEGNK